MSLTSDTRALEPTSNPAGGGRKPVGSFRLIGYALLWMTAALIGAAAGAAIAAFALGFGAALMRVHFSPIWYRLNAGLFTLVGALSLQGVLLLAALRQADRIGRGNRRTGLGWGPIDHRPTVAALAAVLLCCDCALIFLAGHSPFLLRLAAKAGSFPFAPAQLTGGWRATVLALQMVLAVVIAPVCEELFFRGWLWTALRRAWNIGPVMLVTAVLWLGMHLADGIYRPLFLVPAAIILTSIRAIAGGVRASIVAHILNNGFAVTLMMSVVSFR